MKTVGRRQKAEGRNNDESLPAEFLPSAFRLLLSSLSQHSQRNPRLTFMRWSGLITLGLAALVLNGARVACGEEPKPGQDCTDSDFETRRFAEVVYADGHMDRGI